MICATLGHVDHGKTALLRALTGVDADRLPEEKARGMTIDLGFAYRRVAPQVVIPAAPLVIPAPPLVIPAPPLVIPANAGIHPRTPTPPAPSLGPLIAFVDVPGHERFIRNMLAGVAAIDLGLLVVAADDGVMPQTREHAAIAALLRLPRLVIVVTKVDRVDAHRVDAVASQAHALLRELGFPTAPVFRVSPTRGDGIPALSRHIESQAAALPARPSTGPARFAIDRAFTLKGAGTVVTGTVIDGAISEGDELLLSPLGRPARVRGLRMHDASVAVARAGERCAIQLAGIAVDGVERGQWLVSPALHRPTRRVDVQLRSTGDGDLSGRTQLQLHVGTGAVTARLVAVHPGADGGFFATLVADRELCVHRDDRFILRDAGRQRVVAGGRVLDPFAPVERRSAPGRLERLRALEAGSAVQVARELARATGHLDLAAFAVAWKLDAAQARALVGAAGLAMLGPAFAVEPSRITELCGEVLAALAVHHARQPRSSGMPLAAVHAVARTLPAACVDEVVSRLCASSAVVVHGGHVRLAAHKPALDAQAEALWRRVQPKLAKAGAEPARVTELADRLQVERDDLLDVLRRKVGEGELLRLADDRYAVRQAVETVARVTQKVARAQPDARFTAAQFRDALGTGRGLAIEWLEWLDRQRITVRAGDLRRVTAHAATVTVARPAARGSRQNWRRRHRFGAPDTR